MPAYRQLFQRFPSPVFIETGSYLGDGIQMAIEAGFETIYSIEIAQFYYDHCKERFRNMPCVNLYLGDSCIVLDQVLKNVHSPATFWLDGHYSEGGTGYGQYESPLMQEIEAIGRHDIKTHNILIDDLRCWNIDQHGFDRKVLMDRISSINPCYEFIIEDGLSRNHIYYEDILIAICRQ
jgi:hypothetical protein